jgi:hypothetical protein
MRKWFVVLSLALFVCSTSFAFAKEAERITVEGTIQGLISTCAGKTCKLGEEDVIAALEEHYGLLTDAGKFYLLPNLKDTQLSRYLGKMVRIRGEMALGDIAIIVYTAEVLDTERGKWSPFSSPEILDQAEKLRLAPFK